ncbi:11680_t:CDS:2 [Dentiscutata heterogama]|uniref:11680_t:CDS:1 n=1 Tax=Dentiscutata heterogama TaxID=1316150 RepID=A0ACA9KYY0_9GLOM|nr:11680_t:CDS:2 [Dentiscutata heterogama]
MLARFKPLIIQAVRNSTTTERLAKEVTIEIDEESNSYTQKVDTEQSLSNFRKELSDLYEQNPNGRPYIYKNMFFVGKGGGIISEEDENDCKLSDVLHYGNIIKIKRSLKHIDESEIIKRCKLEYGIKMSDDGPVEPHKNKKAFEFIKQNEVVELFQQIADIYSKVESITRNNKYEIIYQKNLITNLKVSTNLPWSSLSTSLNISHKRSNKRANYNETSMTFDVNLQGRAKVIMTNKIRPSKEFEKAVDHALRCPNPIEELKGVCNEYGEFWAREIIIGGKIQIVRDDFVEINTQTEERMLGAGCSIDIRNNNSSLQYNRTENRIIDTNSRESRTRPMYIGGDINMARENVNDWIKTLENYTKWRIVEYRDVVSIFEILDYNLRRRVLDTLGKNILYAKVDLRELTFFQNQKPCIHELDIPKKYKENLKDYQIFATIISKKGKGTFSVRVMYTTDNNSTNLHSANLLIHQFRKSGGNRPREYSLKIGWIIIGIPNDFNYFDFEGFDDLKELEVKLCNNFSSNHQNALDIYDEYEEYKTNPLVTCALRNSDSLRYNPLELKIVTGIHFHYTPEKHLQMCIHNHDLASVRNEDILSYLSVQYCITHRDHSSVPKGMLRHNTIFRKKTKWECIQPDFASLYQKAIGSCVPGLLKITPENVVFKPFNGITFNEKELLALYYMCILQKCEI